MFVKTAINSLEQANFIYYVIYYELFEACFTDVKGQQCCQGVAEHDGGEA